MCKTPSKMHMYDMVKIDTIVFKGGGGVVSCFKYPDRIGLREHHTSQLIQPTEQFISFAVCGNNIFLLARYNLLFVGLHVLTTVNLLLTLRILQ